MKRLNALTVVMLLVITPFFSSGQGMTAQKVIDKIQETYRKQMKDVNDMTKITDKSTSYQKWEGSGESATYKLRNEQEVNGKKQISVYDGTHFWFKAPYSEEATKTERELDPMVFYEYLDSWDFYYQGEEQKGGRNCHVLEVSGVDLNEMVDPTTGEPIVPANTGGMEDATVDARLYVDAGEWVMVQMDFDVNGLMMQNRERSATSTIKYEDIREKNGVLVPYRTITKTEVSMTDQEREQAKKAQESMEQMQEQMKDMSEDQRKMMQQRMGSQMEQMKQSMHYMTGENEIIEEVEEVKINTGISDDLFDGSNL